MQDKQVAGFYTANDRPEAMEALKHVLLERKNTVKDNQTATQVADMIRSIEARDAENEARDKARIDAAIARGKEKGEA